MSAVTSMPLMILVVWVAMVQSECITNPMIKINKEAEKQYLTTDEFLDDMKKSSLNKYENLLRVYGIYRACMESGTKRWTDNVGTGSGSCPYCRTKVEDEDKILIRPKLPEVWNSSSCAAVKFCHESQQGCFLFGIQRSDEDCKTLASNRDGRDVRRCVGDGKSKLGDYTCQSCKEREWVRMHRCPIMCGLCRPRCDFFCKNYGKMKKDLCECDCFDMYTGKECEELDCSRQENEWCNTYSKYKCDTQFRSTRCPKLCGLCKT